MGKWTNDVTLQPIAFDGDSITFTVKRLLTEDMGVLLQHYDAEKGVIRFESQDKLAAVAAEIFPKYITGISGMTKADGTAFTVDEFVAVAKEFYFAPVIGQLFAQIMVASTVGAAEKNSEPPSGA